MHRITRSIRVLLALLLLAAFTLSDAQQPMSVQARAQTITPQAALIRVLTAPHEQSAWFAPLFLAQMSAAQVEQGVVAIKAQFGPYRSLAPRPDGSFVVTFARGTAHAQIHLDAEGRIDGLLFTKPQFTYVSRAAALQGLRALPGQVSLLVTRNGTDVMALDPDRALAIGSAFKLAVMAALKARVVSHQLSWQQSVTLLAEDKSLPSGMLQTKPLGSRYTIADVARDMIAISDNTAGNMLIRVVGRAAIDPLIPPRDRPILTTRELFVLKDPANHALRDHYLAAVTPAARLSILQQADRLPLPSVATLGPLFAKGPVSPRVEWFFSARDLCGLMGQVQHLPQMSVNPGVANPTDWAHVAYKGGSEPGVLNLTTMVTAHNGATYCVAATWNNTALLDEGRFEALYSSLLHALS